MSIGQGARQYGQGAAPSEIGRLAGTLSMDHSGRRHLLDAERHYLFTSRLVKSVDIMHHRMRYFSRKFAN